MRHSGVVGLVGADTVTATWLSMSMVVFFFKQKTAYEIYQCDWSSDVCSSDLLLAPQTETHSGKSS